MSDRALMGQEGTAVQPQNQLQIKACAEEEDLTWRKSVGQLNVLN